MTGRAGRACQALTALPYVQRLGRAPPFHLKKEMTALNQDAATRGVWLAGSGKRQRSRSRRSCQGGTAWRHPSTESRDRGPCQIRGGHKSPGSGTAWRGSGTRWHHSGKVSPDLGTLPPGPRTQSRYGGIESQEVGIRSPGVGICWRGEGDHDVVLPRPRCSPARTTMKSCRDHDEVLPGPR